MTFIKLTGQYINPIIFWRCWLCDIEILEADFVHSEKFENNIS